MGAAVALRNVVGERQDIFIIAVIPFKRDVDSNAVPLPVDGDRIGKQRCFRTVEIFDERGNPAFIIEFNLFLFGVAGIDKKNPDARIEKGKLAVTMFKFFKIKL